MLNILRLGPRLVKRFSKKDRSVSICTSWQEKYSIDSGDFRKREKKSVWKAKCSKEGDGEDNWFGFILKENGNLMMFKPKIDLYLQYYYKLLASYEILPCLRQVSETVWKTNKQMSNTKRLSELYINHILIILTKHINALKVVI